MKLISKTAIIAAAALLGACSSNNGSGQQQKAEQQDSAAQGRNTNMEAPAEIKDSSFQLKEQALTPENAKVIETTQQSSSATQSVVSLSD